MSNPISIINDTFAAVVSGGAIAAAIAGYIPYILAVPAAVFYIIMVIESRTVQNGLQARRVRRSSARIAKLEAEKKVIEAELEAVLLKKKHEVYAEIKVESARKAADALIQHVSLLENKSNGD